MALALALALALVQVLVQVLVLVLVLVLVQVLVLVLVQVLVQALVQALALVMLPGTWLPSTGSCSQSTEPCSQPTSCRTESPLRQVRSGDMGSMCRRPCRARSDHPLLSCGCLRSRRPRSLSCTGSDRRHRLLPRTGRHSGTGSSRSPQRPLPQGVGGRGDPAAGAAGVEVEVELLQRSLRYCCQPRRSRLGPVPTDYR